MEIQKGGKVNRLGKYSRTASLNKTGGMSELIGQNHIDPGVRLRVGKCAGRYCLCGYRKKKRQLGKQTAEMEIQ